MPTRKRRSNSKRNQERKMTRKLKGRVERIKGDMAEISAQQKYIKEGQREVKETFEEIESECEKLRMETKYISQQSEDTQFRLNLLFSILKAREDNDIPKATNLIQSLRELIRKQNEEKQALVGCRCK